MGGLPTRANIRARGGWVLGAALLLASGAAGAQGQGDPARGQTPEELTVTVRRAELRGPLRELGRLQELVARSALAHNPEVRRHLERLEAGEVSLQTLAGMGNALARRGATEFALGYYALAVRLEPSLPGLWVNVGTLYRDVGRYGEAVSAYRRALRLDPNHALAHYNLGAVYDALGRYDESIEELLVALTLDPSLGDPSVNPQSVNNERLPVAQLLLYQRRAGAQGLPLIPAEELAPPKPGS